MDCRWFVSSYSHGSFLPDCRCCQSSPFNGTSRSHATAPVVCTLTTSSTQPPPLQNLLQTQCLTFTVSDSGLDPHLLHIHRTYWMRLSTLTPPMPSLYAHKMSVTTSTICWTKCALNVHTYGSSLNSMILTMTPYSGYKSSTLSGSCNGPRVVGWPSSSTSKYSL